MMSCLYDQPALVSEIVNNRWKNNEVITLVPHVDTQHFCSLYNACLLSKQITYKETYKSNSAQLKQSIVVFSVTRASLCCYSCIAFVEDDDLRR